MVTSDEWMSSQSQSRSLHLAISWEHLQTVRGKWAEINWKKLGNAKKVYLSPSQSMNFLYVLQLLIITQHSFKNDGSASLGFVSRLKNMCCGLYTAVTTPSCREGKFEHFSLGKMLRSVWAWCSPWSRGEQGFFWKVVHKDIFSLPGKTFRDANTGIPRNDDGCRNSILLMTSRFPDLGSASDWSMPRGKFASTNQLSFCRETSSACVEIWEWKSEWDFFKFKLWMQLRSFTYQIRTFS